MRRFATLVLALAALAGCATRKPPERPPLSASEKEQLRGYWALFVDHDPGWPEARSRWLSMSEAARNTLVENLIRHLADAFNGNRLAEAKRAAAELVLLDRLSLEYLVFIVGDDRNSRGLRDLAVSCLVNIGTPAVPGLIGCLASPRFQARRLAARGLGRIGDARAIAPLIRRLAEDANFVVRKEAANALGRFRDDRAAGALSRAVAREEDPLVAAEAARSLGRTKAPRAVAALVGRLRAEEASGTSVALIRTLRSALHGITSLPADSPLEAFGSWRAAATR